MRYILLLTHRNSHNNIKIYCKDEADRDRYIMQANKEGYHVEIEEVEDESKP